ncbi:MAG: bifunctional acetaldehyde-CoA/alcohol dehydrogenase [Mycoplasmoidaceae bacterium]
MVKNIIEKSKIAQEKFSNYSQEKIDQFFYIAAKAANDARIPLAIKAFEETGMGVIEDKIVKNHFASEIFYNAYKDLQTSGVFESNESTGIEKIYEPIGVIAAVIPTTNPTSTAIFKILLCIKTRNSIIISPHPRAWESTVAAAKIIKDAVVKEGLPEDIIQWLPKGSGINLTSELMADANLTLATGGGALVKAAYSSGKPAIGVGAGNCPALIHSSANIPLAVSSIIQSNTFDNGVVCATENSIIVLNSIKDKFIKELEKQGAFYLDNKADISKIESKMFKENAFGILNPNVVGKDPQALSKIFDINIPEWAKILVVAATCYNYEDALAHEKLSTFVSLYTAEDFNEAIKIQSKLLELGPGHTSSIFIDENKFPDLLSIYKNNIKTGRLIVNSPSSLGGVGGLYNFSLMPTLTIGCGSWGNNIFSENIGPKHLLNIKTVASRRENMLWFRVPPKIYFKFGAINEAFKDFKDDNVKKAGIITDDFIWSLYGKQVSKLLNDLKINFTIFSDVEPNPTIETCRKGASVINSYKPDVLIAIGGGSPLDAAKIIWLFSEYPDAKFDDLALRFADIRRRIVKFPKLGTKTKLICIPTTAGTGSEVTPFAVITDEKTHIKYPLADYALTPNVAICDASLMMSLPKGMTAATGLDAIAHNIEAIASILSSEFTDPLAMQSLKMLFDNLKNAYDNGATDTESRQAVAHAATMAGMAFANAFLGIVHSLSHKIGGHLNVVHGLANAIYLPHVIYYNSEEHVREKQGYFSQFKTSNTRSKYAKIADLLGLKGKTEAEKIDSLIIAIRKLTQSLNAPVSTKEFGVDSNKFYEILNVMSIEAFDDQCTGANPRIPLIKDLKRIFINAHEDCKIPSLAKPDPNEYKIYHEISIK